MMRLEVIPVLIVACFLARLYLAWVGWSLRRTAEQPRGIDTEVVRIGVGRELVASLFYVADGALLAGVNGTFAALVALVIPALAALMALWLGMTMRRKYKDAVKVG